MLLFISGEHVFTAVDAEFIALVSQNECIPGCQGFFSNQQYSDPRWLDYIRSDGICGPATDMFHGRYV